MLDRLKVVYGAVHDRALLSVLSHLFIYDGRAQATDGRMSIDAVFPELKGLNATVPADRFLAAIEASDGEPQIEERDGRIVIVSGSFRARIPTLPLDQFPKSDPDPPDWELEDEWLPGLRRMRPFIATDAANQWSTALLVTTDTMVATNNVCLVSEPCSLLDGTGVKAIAIPNWALDEVLRMGEEPTAFGVSDRSITFYFDDTWIKTQLITADWPIVKALDLFKNMPKKPPRVPDNLAKAVKKILPFCKDTKFPVILMGAAGVWTEDHVHQAEVSGIQLPEMRFNGNMLELVLDHADHMVEGPDTKMYFRIGPARGILMGLRQ